MEDDIRQYLILIVNTIAKALMWMMAAVVWGLRLKWAYFIEEVPFWKNIIFYTVLVVSFSLLLKHIINKWYPKKNAG